MRRRRYSRLNSSLIEALEERELFSMVVLNHFRSFHASGTQQFPAKAGASISVAPPQPQPQALTPGDVIIPCPLPGFLGQTTPSAGVLTMSQPAIEEGTAPVIVLPPSPFGLGQSGPSGGVLTISQPPFEVSVLIDTAHSTVTTGGAITLRAAATSRVITYGGNGSVSLIDAQAGTGGWTTGINTTAHIVLVAHFKDELPSPVLQESTYLSSSTSRPPVQVTDLGTAEGLAWFMKSLSQSPENIGGTTTSPAVTTEYAAQSLPPGQIV